MPKSWEQVAETMAQRRRQRGPLLEQCMAVRERYNGDWVLPELGGDVAPLTPTIIADAIDHNGLRAASVMPDIIAPALDGTKPNGVRSRDWANKRRKAWTYVWERSELNLHLRRAYRHLFGYATAVLSVEPDFTNDCPKIVVRDPLHAFPEPKAAEDLTPPMDCGFIYGKSAAWIRHSYPDAPDWVRPGRDGTDLWDIVEWVDEDSIMLGILGPRWTDNTFQSFGDAGNMRPHLLRRWPNRAGRCTVVTPQRLTLDAIGSQVAKIVGHADLQARLLYLDILATQKSIVPDRYILGTSAMVPRLVGNQWKDGSTGEVNIVLDAQAVGELRGTPDPNNKVTQDRLERNARLSTGQTAPMMGEAYGGARTGRGIDALLSAAVDPRIQEAQEVMQARLTDVNRIVGATFCGYWPARKYTVFSGWTADPEMVEFTPGGDIRDDAGNVTGSVGGQFVETIENKVAYPLPGTDMVGMNVVIGQLVGTELTSRRTARVMHPFIRDAEYEERQVLTEKLSAAMEMQLLSRASDPMGGLTPVDLARIAALVGEGTPLAEAIATADAEARARQAAEAPPPGEGMAQAPEMMPGLANPGEGAESQPPPDMATIGPPQSGLANLDRLFGALTAPPLDRVR